MNKKITGFLGLLLILQWGLNPAAASAAEDAVPFAGETGFTEAVAYADSASAVAAAAGLDLQRVQTGYQQYGIVRRFQDGSLLWEFITPEAPLTELETISNLFINQDTAYITASGTLYALGLENGQVRWTVDGVGASNSIVFDKYGTIYISGYYGPNVMVIRSDGSVVYKDNDFSYGWVYKLDITADTLLIYYALDDSGEVDGLKSMDITQFYPPTVSVTVNGDLISFGDQPPVLFNSRTLVPIRAVCEALEAEVFWDEAAQTVTVVRGSDRITVTIGADTLQINGASKGLDTPAVLINGRTLLPIRAVVEGLGCNVDWDDGLQRVVITTESH